MANSNVTSWTNWRDHLKWDPQILNIFQYLSQNPIQDLEVPTKYQDIWIQLNFATQKQKAINHGLSEQQTQEAFSQLIKRPYFLVKLAEYFDCKYMLEVGTAKGLQFFSLAESRLGKEGHVWSCDIKDVCSKKFAERYKENTNFVNGTSAQLAQSLNGMPIAIDFFYIDGAHDRGSVLKDVDNLKTLQSDNPIWVFDDFDVRFGCFQDIKDLCIKNGKFFIYRVGNTASGQPNHQAIIFGKIK